MLINDRVKSFSRDFCTHKKLTFKTKFKVRGQNKSTLQINSTNTPINNEQSESRVNETDRPKAYLFGYGKKDCKLDDDFNKTSSRLQNINFRHHNPNICVCADCNCGRHLCQFHAIKPDLSKNTIYKKDYLKKKPIKNRINISGQYNKLKGPSLEVNSTYDKDFDGRTSEVEKFKPEDTLKLQGPCQELTSYTCEFPGHKGRNQYVRYTDKHTRGYFPMRSRSTYSQSFTGNQRKKDEWDRVPDNLKTGSNWFGRTTYESSFQRPNPQDYSSKCKITQKQEINPNFSRQYETIYRNNFIGHPSGVCPAKVKLETKSKGFFSDHKDEFSQNTDFKSLDPNFHAFSTSQYKWI